MTEALPRELLDGIGTDLVTALVLALGPHFKSGDLQNSIQYRIEDDTILITMLPYWQYVEYGTPGTLQGQSSSVDGHTTSYGPNPDRKMPIHKEGDTFINYLTGKEDFALAKHIQLYGTKPYPFVRPVAYHKAQKIADNNLKRYIRRHQNEKDILQQIQKIRSALGNPLGTIGSYATKHTGSVGKGMKEARSLYKQATRVLR
jgi:hypothetical protein